ncbi:hypothetical protein ACFXK0_21835 [Nocardia sp. NPDC059177]|uniref:hypothetical protein n=1 Tax=Nocardia sp. NPDC059177 TaxID=3346759 RepID=UPI003698271D
MMRRTVIGVLLAGAVLTTGACGPTIDEGNARGTPVTTAHAKFAVPGTSAISPSGFYEAKVNPDGELSMYVSIVDTRTGAEVFRGTDKYSTSRHHRYVVGWLSTAPEELWIRTGDVGTFRVDRGPDGFWTKSGPKVIPSEVADW